MSNTLNLLETGDFPTSNINVNQVEMVTLIDKYTKEIVNFKKASSGPSVIDGIMYLKKDGVLFERIYNGVINAEWFGPGKTNIELQAAINAAIKSDTILIKGKYRCSDQIKINKDIMLLGQNYINGNDVGDNEGSRIIFNDFTNQIANSCIEAVASLCIKNLAVVGSEIPGKIGINLIGVPNGTTDPIGSLTLDSAIVQDFEVGVKVTEGYYNRFVNSYIGYCTTCLVLDKCYNSFASSLSIRAGYYSKKNIDNGDLNDGIVLYNKANLTMFGGSVESFSNAGITLYSSRVSCFGVYFEGEKANDKTSCIRMMNNNCRSTTIGCHTYLVLKRTSSFIHVLPTVTSAHVYSKNNHFDYENNWYTSVYKFEATDFEGYNIDISGDNYQNGLNAGSSYISITSSLLKKGKGMIQIIYPSGHELAGLKLTNLNTTSPYQYNTVTGQENGMITTFANSGYPGDDPAGLYGQIGYTPYTAVFENGSWKKIPKL
ncbi:hypothetical protein C1637_16065 [Chryseobacterium lactis]|uniref:Right-handed parallel beta-helix repeat-containing protein n=1 Tax=Chryseobacterium lactis TaxID=1241981 RepID=A0A3G6RQT8_CHRLC|nr:hypothetical protein [Chryseobacterium lactis]AZA84008.1 hypothetical protein EG342_19905 [Chryseobacterium lactis]AZB04394.1 hypothetical protein EG341_10780 [Chryseobacterium lactis]PNW12563.1 hypothetical protein C1637_16065 [Chryseobacterium lactis]